MGRPSKYTPELVEEICARLAKGEPMTVICRSAERFPDPATVWRWAEDMPDVAQAIARARLAGEDSIAEDCMLIADDATGDYRLGEKNPLVDTDHIQRSKLRIETRLKLLAKWNPKKWGDSIRQEVTGANGGPIETKEMGTNESARRIAFMLTQAALKKDGGDA